MSASSPNATMSMPCAAASTTFASILARVCFGSPQTGVKFTTPSDTTCSNCS